VILVATNERDLTSDYVVLELRRRDLQFTRLNTETLSRGRVQFQATSDRSGWEIEIDNKIIHLSDIRAGYFRRPGTPKAPINVSRKAERRYCEAEWSAILGFALYSIESRWLNSPQNIFLAENKPLQLRKAADIGLNIPDTIVTNSFEEASRFVRRGPAICKPLKSALIGEADDERVIFTTRINSLPSSIEASIEAAPFIVQREIKKRFDIRATVVGDNVFSAAIHSQIREETTTDWRKGSHTDLPHEAYELPKDVADGCIRLTRALGLKFGAIDLILDLSGKFWFLEINPNGQWAWIENRTGLPITRAIVDELERISHAT
jgi:glutathione synthase/RimK-type ligase-like ATP-grasp enzyme